MIKDDFDISCSFTLSLPPSDEAGCRAQDILDAIHRIANRLGKMSLKELKVYEAGCETFLVNGPVLGRIYGVDGVSEHIANTKKVRVEVDADRVIHVTEE